MNINNNKIIFSNFWKYMFVSLFIIIFFYKVYNTIDINSTPIISQINKYVQTDVYKIFSKFNNEPVYGNLSPKYTGSEYAGEITMKGDLVHEQIVEDKCSMGKYIKSLEIGENNGFVNYIIGTCSDGKKLKILGDKLKQSKKNVIKERHGINAVNVKYDESYLNEIYQVGKKEDDGKKIGCGNDNIIIGYRGRAENPDYNNNENTKDITDFRIKHLQFICNAKNAEKNIPVTHRKCGDDGDVCKFEKNNQYIYYGVPGVKVVKIDKKKINGNVFTCFPKGYLAIRGNILPINDPLPSMKKSCYLEMKGLTEKDIQKMINKDKYRLWGA